MPRARSDSMEEMREHSELASQQVRHNPLTDTVEPELDDSGEAEAHVVLVIIESFSRDPTPHDWGHYILSCLWQQAKVVLAIAAYLFFTPVLLLERPWPSAGELASMALGVCAVILGLAMFLEGLRFGVMPLGEAVGTLLPRLTSIRTTLLTALILGVGCTLAEPAVGALEEVGRTLDGITHPYLWYLINHWTTGLVIAVGTGVGAAAVVGTLRFLHGWSFKRPLWIALICTLTTTALFAVSTSDSADGIVALAWDCGAITTGPVTVPIVLSLGVGVVASTGVETTPLASFGLVTLASLYPVVTVLALASLLIQIVPEQDIINAAIEAKGHLGVNITAAPQESDELPSPLREMLGACRALLPLVLFLLGVLVFGLKQPLPQVSIQGMVDKEKVEVSTVTLYPGLCCAFSGLIVFNIGLTHGLSALGEFAGSSLPAAFTDLDSVEGSPLLPRGPGIFAVLVFAFILGIGATLAEPALAALGDTVSRLTNGRFPSQVVSVAVPIGVACGLVSGITKVLEHVPVNYLVLALYPVAAVMTVVNADDLSAIAWDSAGVTTGPVTVPLVLALGAGLSESAHAKTGFGILTMASICPIIVVLAYGILRQQMCATHKEEDSPSSPPPVETRRHFSPSTEDCERRDIFI